MSSYLERNRRRVLGGADTVIEAKRLDMMRDFDRYLEEHALSSHLVPYTKPDEFPDIDKLDKERVAIIDVAINDKTHLDEKFILCRNECELDVGSYIYWNDSWYLIGYEEVKPTMTHKKYVATTCNNYINIEYKGEVYRIPMTTTNLTLYSKGLHDYKYMTVGDAKRNVYVGSNPITLSMQPGFRIILGYNDVFKITHVNDFEFTRKRDKGVGLLKFLMLETTFLAEDNIEDMVAYNPIGKQVDEESATFKTQSISSPIKGEKIIYVGQTNKYTIKYNGNIKFELDAKYYNTVLVDNGDNSCSIQQKFDYDEVGRVISLIAKDKETNATIDILNVVVKGV